jgi:hypothetical protein
VGLASTSIAPPPHLGPLRFFLADAYDDDENVCYDDDLFARICWLGLLIVDWGRWGDWDVSWTPGAAVPPVRATSMAGQFLP